jgi:hypothetical protein
MVGSMEGVTILNGKLLYLYLLFKLLKDFPGAGNSVSTTLSVSGLNPLVLPLENCMDIYYPSSVLWLT